MKIKSGKLIVLAIFAAFLAMLAYILLWLLGDQPARLRAAAYRGDAGEVQRLLDKHPAWINIPDKYGTTPLLEATASLDKETLTLLLSRGANVNATNYQGASAIHLFIGNEKFPALQQISTLQALLDKGANLNLRDDRGRTPLGKLNARAQPQLASWLREHGATE